VTRRPICSSEDEIDDSSDSSGGLEGLDAMTPSSPISEPLQARSQMSPQGRRVRFVHAPTP
jgi:hypothetical protein